MHEAGEPFESADDCWFWTMAAITLRTSGARRPAASVQRPCTLDDIVKLLDRLYRARRIDLADVRVLRTYGERGVAPSRVDPREAADRDAWNRVMSRLEPALLRCGIVRAPQPKRKEVA